MKWIKQNPGEYCCGQIAVAVATNQSLKKIVKLVGHDSRTNTKTLVKSLKKLGYQCPDRLKVLKQKPKLALAKLTYPDTRNWHWVVIYKDKIYDGYWGNKHGKVRWKKSWKITSYLPIKKIKG